MKRLFSLVFGLCSAFWAWGQASDSDQIKVSVDGLRHDWYVVPTGVDLGFALGPWKLSAGGGYEHFTLGRDTATGDPLSGGSNPYSKQPFPNQTLNLRYTWPLEEVSLWAGTGSLAYGKLGSGPNSDGAFPDLPGNWLGYLEAGATRDRRVFNAHGLESGTFAETSAQWSPSALAARATDYYRVRLRSSLFLPLWDMEGPVQWFSGEAAFRANIRWTDGKAVPYPLLLPTDVRGYNDLYDAKFLSVATAELRVRLPSLRGVHDIVPVGFGFVDAGQYWGYADSATAGTKGGFLLGTGIGGGLELFGAATPTLTIGLPLVGASGLWWDLDFQLKF